MPRVRGKHVVHWRQHFHAEALLRSVTLWQGHTRCAGQLHCKLLRQGSCVALVACRLPDHLKWHLGILIHHQVCGALLPLQRRQIVLQMLKPARMHAANACTAPPILSVCTAGSTAPECGTGTACPKGQYQSGSTCSSCPTGTTTSGTGATSNSACSGARTVVQHNLMAGSLARQVEVEQGMQVGIVLLKQPPGRHTG